MITKERLEERIRGVIREFKRTKRIPDPTADELTAALEAQVDDLFDQEAIAKWMTALATLKTCETTHRRTPQRDFFGRLGRGKRRAPRRHRYLD